MSTSGIHAAVLDSEHRPIIAGGFVDAGPIVFRDIAEQSGLANWRHVMGTPEKTYILETVGSGVALLDYDNDGHASEGFDCNRLSRSQRYRRGP